MDTKAFISYSTVDKKYGAAIKTALDEIGIKSFLAHDDLKVSEVWQKRIISELKECRIFVPLLSEAFKASEWCGQELGFIMKRRQSTVLIIPLSIDKTNPYGFISHLQRQRIPSSGIDSQILMDAIGRKWPSVVIGTLLEAVERHAHSFREAEYRIRLLVPYFDKMSKEQAGRLARIAVRNDQIWDANLCRDEYLPQFLKLNKTNISKLLYTALKYQVKH